MEKELSQWVDQAADIAASGRWAAANARIENLVRTPGANDAWWVQVMVSLCYQVFSEYLQLKRAYEEKQGRGSSLLAWRARNLLELSVWSLYCTQGRENARRLYEDAGRDTRDVFNAFIKWGTARSQPSDWLDPLGNANQALLQRAASEGIDSLEGTYKAVSEAAKECGLADNFSLSYKMLSKFAHPTAMQILAGPDDAKEELQRDVFFSQGCLFFIGAFVALERELDDS